MFVDDSSRGQVITKMLGRNFSFQFGTLQNTVKSQLLIFNFISNCSKQQFSFNTFSVKQPTSNMDIFFAYSTITVPFSFNIKSRLC